MSRASFDKEKHTPISREQAEAMLTFRGLLVSEIIAGWEEAGFIKKSSLEIVREMFEELSVALPETVYTLINLQEVEIKRLTLKIEVEKSKGEKDDR